MPDFGRELSGEIKKAELSRRTLPPSLLKGTSERLMAYNNYEISALNHMLEVTDGLVDCKKLIIVRVVLLLRGDENAREERQLLPSVNDMLMQRETNSGTPGVHNNGQSKGRVLVCQQGGSGDTRHGIIKSSKHGWWPGHWVGYFDLMLDETV